MDVAGPETRSRMMAGIRSKNMRPEIVVGKVLFAAGFKFRLHRRDLLGAPNIVMSWRRIAIFVHGCFWHQHNGCRFAKLPATRPKFSAGKLSGNVARDSHVVRLLKTEGWRVLSVWECATRDSVALARLRDTLGSWIDGLETQAETRGFGNFEGN